MNTSPFLHEWQNQTTLHPIGLLAVLVLGAAMFILPRRYALVPMLVMACFISPAQRIVVLTLDFHLLRLMVLMGWLRLICQGELRHLTWKPADTIVVLWTFFSAVAYTILHGTLPAFVNRLGFAFDAAGMYFLFRMLIRDWKDIETIARSAAFISVPVAVAFLIEKSTGRNFFSIFGGVPELTAVRDEKLRCQGAYAHPLLAGCFWVSLMPLIASLWWRGGSGRFWAPVGLACSMIVIVTCTSNTPLLALLVGLAAASWFPFRRWTPWLRLMAIGGIVGLHLVMAGPVWGLIARFNIVGGATGWYRFKLLDEFIRRIDEWWLVGVQSTRDWWKWGLDDITNQYVTEGINGGLITLALFVTLLLLSFRGVGRMLRCTSRRRSRQIMSWALGVSLLVHCVAFLAVSYFGQIIMLWYLTLAMITSMSPPKLVVLSHRIRLARLRYVRRQLAQHHAIDPPTHGLRPAHV